MTITRADLDTRYAEWFRGVRNAEQVKQEIVRLFSEEPDECNRWTEQDIYEQSRKIIERFR